MRIQMWLWIKFTIISTIAKKVRSIFSFLKFRVSSNSNAITLHLYLHRDLQPLNTMLSQESVMNSNKSFNQGMLGNVHSNLWLIQMPKNATKEYMEDMFLETPLQFDTMAFAFTLINGENKITSKSILMIIILFFMTSKLKVEFFCIIYW